MSDSFTTRSKDIPATRAGTRVEGNGAERTAAMTDRLRSLSLDKAPQAETKGGSRRWGRWLVLVALLAGGGVAARQYYTGGGRILFPETPEVETLTVQSEFSEALLMDTAGFLIVKSRVDVSPKVPGTIVELPIEEGKLVQAGDLLARLDDVQYKADFDAAKAGLASAEARLAELNAGARDEEKDQARTALDSAKNRLKVAQADIDRAEQLGNAISVAELELRKANLKDAEGNVSTLEKKLHLLEIGARKETRDALEAEVERARATVGKAQYLLDCTRVIAPISGTILKRSHEVGEMVRPEALTNGGLCVIADTSEMEAEVDIQERDIEQVKVGQPCRITVEAYPDYPYEGQFIRRLPVINRSKGTVGARVKVLNPDEKLLPDMNCRVVFLKNEAAKNASDTLRVPPTAVVTTKEGTALFVLDGETARRRKVVLGETQGDLVEIKEGLVAGETIILPGKGQLKDGATVKRAAKP